jgi:hypothetical protein
LDARLKTLFYKKIIVAKNLKLDGLNPRNGKNLAESSKEGYGSKRAVLPMMMMMMMMMMYKCIYFIYIY